MDSLASLILPILLAAVAVFILSSVIHMFLGYHNNDFRPVPDEAAVQAALRSLPPGDYGVPHAGSMEAMRSPEFLEKMKTGPIVFMTVLPGQPMTMGRELSLWFVFCLVVSAFAAYVTAHAVGQGATTREVFCLAGVTSFMGYALANWANTIWFKRSAMTNVRNTFDGLLYGLATGAVFAWLMN